MAIYLGSPIFAFVLFSLLYVLRRKLDQVTKSVQGLFGQLEQDQDERTQAQGRHLVGSSGNEKLQYKPPAAQGGKPYHMTMGLKRLDMENWLTIDSEYMTEHIIRKELLDNSLPSVVQCLPGTELACTEALKLVVDFLVSHYPETFILEGSGNTSCIRNEATKESFSLVDVANPLEVAARLAMEDFSILVKDPSDEQYHLMASATLFPVGWKLQERIGGTMTVLHKPVPQWQEKLSCPINRFFDRLSLTSTMERSNTFIQTTPTLHVTTRFPTSPFHSNSPTNNQNRNQNHTPPSSIILRNERQTFRRLPQSGAILFTVHTFMNPLTSLSDDELNDFVMQMRGWPQDTARYKGREVWGDVVEGYCRARCCEVRR